MSTPFLKISKYVAGLPPHPAAAKQYAKSIATVFIITKTHNAMENWDFTKILYITIMDSITEERPSEFRRNHARPPKRYIRVMRTREVRL